MPMMSVSRPAATVGREIRKIRAERPLRKLPIIALIMSNQSVQAIPLELQSAPRHAGVDSLVARIDRGAGRPRMNDVHTATRPRPRATRQVTLIEATKAKGFSALGVAPGDPE